MRTLYLIAGVPASGKSTILRHWTASGGEMFARLPGQLRPDCCYPDLGLADNLTESQCFGQKDLDSVIGMVADRSILVHVDLFNTLEFCRDYCAGLDAVAVSALFEKRFKPLVSQYEKFVAVTIEIDFNTFLERIEKRRVENKYRNKIYRRVLNKIKRKIYISASSGRSKTIASDIVRKKDRAQFEKISRGWNIYVAASADRNLRMKFNRESNSYERNT